MTPLIIIPARGGSKGIPGKNIKPLVGRPLIAYTIDVARQIARADHILLSTDSEEIAATARAEGLDVPFMRPAELGGDHVGSREVILDAMDRAGDMGLAYDVVVLLQPTSPFRTAADVEAVLDRYAALAPDVDMVVSVTESATNPYLNCYERDADGWLRIAKGDGRLRRRQDAPPTWEFNGAVYAIRPDAIRMMELGDMPRRAAVEMPRERSVDLDTPLDWVVAEAIAQYFRNN